MNCLFIAILLPCFVIVRTDCVWYDCDNQSPPNYKSYRGPPKPIEPDAVKLIQSLCKDDYGNATASYTTTCCSKKQLEYVNKNMALARLLLERCPQCIMNLERFFCRLTCSGDQSEYLAVTADKTGELVKSASLNLTEALMNGIYRSCDSIWASAFRKKAMDVLCASEECTPQKFFTRMGSTDNEHISFDIKINPQLRIKNVLNFDWRPCNESFDGKPPCGCTDCEDTCGPPWPKPSTEETPRIFGVRLLSFVMICIFLAGLVLLAVIIWLNEGFRPIVESLTRVNRSEMTLLRRSQSGLNGEQTEHLESHSTPGNVTDVPQKHRKIVRQREKQSTAFSTANQRGQQKDETVQEEGTVPEPHRRKKSCFQGYVETSARTDNALMIIFRTTTRGMITRPWIPLLGSFLFIAALSYGVIFLRVEKDPVRLWSDKHSQTFLEREYFNEQFEPFFRVEQLIIRPTDLSTFTEVVDDVIVTFGPVFRRKFLTAALELQLRVQNTMTMGNIKLSDICFAPLVNNNTDVSKCMILSLFGYIANDPDKLDDDNYAGELQNCIRSSVNCLAPYGGPIMPETILGGYSKDGTKSKYLLATSLIITFLVNNYNDDDRLAEAKNWEGNFTDFMDEWVKKEQPSNMKVAYHAERSFEDEIQKESRSDIIPLLSSYGCMFIYIALGLGRRIGAPKYFVYSKMGLGFGGIAIVIASVASSVGFFSYIGIPVTLIVIEVVPFLVLAVGTDNMFIIVQTMNNTPSIEGESDKERMMRVIGLVGPTTLLTTAAEVSCFLLGALSPMPAVQQFCLYAGVALIVAFLLQFTAFVALLSIDLRRQEAGRLDVFCCKNSGTAAPPPSLLISRLFNSYIVPALFRPTVRIIIVILFWALFCFAISSQPKVTIGLDAADVMNKDSSSVEYLRAISEMRIGPPVFFVVREGLDYTQEEIQNCITSSYGSNEQSLTQMIHQASRSSSWTYIVSPAMSWLDDLIDWATAEDLEGDKNCCRFHKKDQSFCQPDDEDKADCTSCFEFTTALGRPQPNVFGRFLAYFLEAIPNQDCPKAGKAAYSRAIKTTQTSDGLTCGATSYMTYHTLLSTTMDYVNAMIAARQIANKIADMLREKTGLSTIGVFPYSVFYVFYEQFETMRTDVLLQSCYAIVAVGLCFFIGTGFDMVGTLALMIASTSIWSCMWGMMYLIHIPLNAISVVNIILAIGISVEFCGHMIISYTHSEEETSVEKATEALQTTGYSVCTGITMTKIIGITLLAFAKSPIYNIFYFRMYLAIIFLGALHGLVLTPIMMSLFGEMGADKFWNKKNEELKKLKEDQG